MNSQLKTGFVAAAVAILFVLSVIFFHDVMYSKNSFLLLHSKFRGDSTVLKSNREYITSLSKDITVHSAYFDSRTRNGHNNITILFLNVNMTFLDSGFIIGCGVDNFVASKFTVYSIFENELMEAWLGPHPVIYQNQLIFCYDLPSKNGSNAFAIYKTSDTSTVKLVAYSRYPVYHPAPRVMPPKGDDFTVVVCTKIHNKHAPWFREFIQYQKTIGVDHIHFSVLDLFIKDGGYDQLVLNDPVVLDALVKGFISFRVWTETYEKDGEVYFHSENLRKLGCIYRYLGTYDYAMPLDTDDFFVPRNNETNLKEYIKKYCYITPAGSCRFDWIRYFLEFGLDGPVGPDGNVTAHLKNKSKISPGNYKSVHRTNITLDVSFHDARCNKCLMPGYKMVPVPQSDAYVAHLRTGEFAKKRTID